MRSSQFLLLLQLWWIVDVSLSQNMCEKLPNVSHAWLTQESRKTQYGPGDEIHLVCETGYISGPTIKYMCGHGGWVVIRPGICRLKPCELPDEIPNGYYQIIHGEDFVFGTTIKYFCNEGYQMMSKTDTRTCALNKWTNHMPVCEPVSCNYPPDGLVVKGLPEDEGPIIADRFIEISCPPGKLLNGSSVLICGQDGEWNFPIPTCEVVSCEPPPEGVRVSRLPDNQGPFLPHSIIEMSCPPEKVLNGPSVLTCGEDGRWNHPLPFCKDKCKVTALPQGVRIVSQHAPGDMLNIGERLEFGCSSPGHLPQGRAEVECLENGNWSHPFPTCGLPTGCARPPILADGETKLFPKFRHRHGERVEYTCQSLYKMKGQPYFTCFNGEWRGDLRCLRPCTIDKELMARHNIAFKYSYEKKLYAPHEDRITFTCTRGKPVDGVAMQQHCLDGEMLLPTCQ